MQLKIQSQILAGFALVIAIALCLGGFSLWQLYRVERHAETVGNQHLPRIEAIALMTAQASDHRAIELELAAMTDAPRVADLQARLRAAHEQVKASDTSLGALIVDPLERSLYATFQAAWRDYTQSTAHVAELALSGDHQQARVALEQDSGPRYQAARETLGKLVKLDHEGAERARAEIREIYIHAVAAVAAALLVMMLAGLLIAWLQARHLTSRLRTGVAMAHAIADGDLRADHDVSGHDEIADLLRAQQRMRTRLAQVVTTVRSNADSVSTASTEIAQGNSDLSSRTEEQASALQQTAASMEQIQGTARHNAHNADQAAALAREASAAARLGGDVVEEVVQTMHQIESTAEQVAEIVGVIDSIAFQTNILALNAAVEAARAADQGRGFAVVAAEVRTLAQRSADAARQIKSLIAANAERVSAGTEQVALAGTSMSKIVTTIQQVSDIMGEIQAASREQSSGVSQIADAVTQMDQVTQQNAALVEESAAAAESLRLQAQGLQTAVAFFRTESQVAPAGITEPPATAAWDGVERRGPNRARNVHRIHPRRAHAPAVRPAGDEGLRTGTDDGWSSF